MGAATTEQPVSPTEEPAVFPDLSGVAVGVGDLVVIRYIDQPERPLGSIRLSDRIHKPEEGILHVLEPLGAAILGRFG